MKMTVSIPDELYWRLQEEIARRRKQQKDAVIEAFENYIHEGEQHKSAAKRKPA